MPTFLLLFRAATRIQSMPRSSEQARASGERWHVWADGLTKAQKLVTGAQLTPAGRIVAGAAKTVADGVHGDEPVGGYFVVTAADLDEATEIAKACPVLGAGGSVEVRPFMAL